MAKTHRYIISKDKSTKSWRIQLEGQDRVLARSTDLSTVVEMCKFLCIQIDNAIIHIFNEDGSLREEITASGPGAHSDH